MPLSRPAAFLVYECPLHDGLFSTLNKAKRWKVVIRMQYKPFAVCGAMATAVALTGVAIGLDGLISRGSWIGTVIEFACLAIVILVMLVGFNFACDGFEKLRSKQNRKAYDSPRRMPTVLTYRGITHSPAPENPHHVPYGTNYGSRLIFNRAATNGNHVSAANDTHTAVANGKHVSSETLLDTMPDAKSWIGQ
jgi:hypothetical protein